MSDVVVKQPLWLSGKVSVITQPLIEFFHGYMKTCYILRIKNNFVHSVYKYPSQPRYQPMRLAAEITANMRKGKIMR